MDSSEAGEFEGWELLQNNSDSESGIVVSLGSGENVSDDNSVNSVENDSVDLAAHSAEKDSDDIAAHLAGEKESEDIDAHSGGMIQANYFSIDAEHKGAVTGADITEEGSESSDNPSWIDPASENRYPRKESAEFWSDSGSERSDDRKVNELEGGNEVLLVGNEKRELGSEGTKEKEISGGGEKKLENFEKFFSDSGGIEVDSSDFEKNIGVSMANANVEVAPEEEMGEKESGCDHKEIKTDEIEPRKAEKNSTIVWWKVPMQFLKQCVFKASPLWSLPVVAAFVGFVILGRRLYRMKKKTRSLFIKVTMEDKKISQIVNRAGRLNEAFSVVKRVPVIRPWLPGTGAVQWPAMSLR